MKEINTTKCPCCKYEHFEGFVKTKVESTFKTGKNAGKPKVEYKLIWTNCGDDWFKVKRFIESVYFECDKLEIDYVYYNECPKCGVLFKSED